MGEYNKMPAIPEEIMTKLQERVAGAENNYEKGRALEDFISSFFSIVPGIEIAARNELNVFETEEVDVALWNNQAPDGFFFLPNILLVECKNWTKPVATRDVAYFIDRLKERGCDYGFLIAINGITGNPSRLTDAHYKIARALSDGIRVIVMTAVDIKNISNTDDLVSSVKGKLCQLVVSGTTIE